MRSAIPTAAGFSLLLAAAAMLLPGAPVQAQTVYRCSVDGRTTYQPTPCDTGAGRTVAIGSGPSEAEAAAARQQATKDKARAAAIPSLPAPQMATGPMPNLPGRKTDCASLIAARDQAMAARNRMRGQARQGDGFLAGSAGDTEVGLRDSAALDADRAARARGC